MARISCKENLDRIHKIEQPRKLSRLKIPFILSKVRRRETQRPTRGTRMLPNPRHAVATRLWRVAKKTAGSAVATTHPCYPWLRIFCRGSRAGCNPPVLQATRLPPQPYKICVYSCPFVVDPKRKAPGRFSPPGAVFCIRWELSLALLCSNDELDVSVLKSDHERVTVAVGAWAGWGAVWAALISDPAGALADCCGPLAKGAIKPINVKVISYSATIRAAPISFFRPGMRRISLLIFF
jgi:hypothetical protein